MALLDDFYRRAQLASTPAPLPVGPDIAPPAMATPSTQIGGVGAPGLMPIPDMLSGGKGGGLSQGSMQGLSQLGSALASKFGGEGGQDDDRYDSPMPRRRPFELGPPFMPENA